MKKYLIGLAATGAAVLLCACQGQVNAKLDNSIGMATYENLGLIEQKPLGVGLVIDDSLKNASTEVVASSIKYHMAVGDALTSRLMYALVLKFQRVQLLNAPVFPDGSPLDALLVVKLKDLDATVKISPKWNTVATESSGWIEVEALLKDRNNQIVWVGTSRSQAEASQESIMVAGAQDASAAMNSAIEATVAKLVAQMAESNSLHDFIAQHHNNPS